MNFRQGVGIRNTQDVLAAPDLYVQMAVDESRKHHASTRVNHCGRILDVGLDVAITAHAENAVAFYGKRLRP